MSAVLAAVYESQEAAELVRTRLVKDGFPTDRVELTSREELGQAEVVPAAGVGEKLARYFEQLFPQEEGGPVPVRQLQAAVEGGKAVIAVQPRGQVEIERAARILNDADPLEIRASDLGNQTMEHAAARQESSTLSWIGRVMVAPNVRDR